MYGVSLVIVLAAIHPFYRACLPLRKGSGERAIVSVK